MTGKVSVMQDASPPRLVLFCKPYHVLSEREGEPGKATVADYVPFLALDPAGRLDYDSEGLVVLTNVGWLQHRVIHPRHKIPKTYIVQVEGKPTAQAIGQLAGGVELSDGLTRPALVQRIAPPKVWRRDPPIQERADLPSSWLKVTLTEGRKRQIRRMTASVGYPTLRLIRISVGPWSLETLQPGEWREVECPRTPSVFVLRMRRQCTQ